MEDVKPGSWAELGSLYVDDLIVEVDGDTVHRESPQEAHDRITMMTRILAILKEITGAEAVPYLEGTHPVLNIAHNALLKAVHGAQVFICGRLEAPRAGGATQTS